MERPVGEVLEGRTFVAVGMTGAELPSGVPMTMEFAGGRLFAHAGCNRIFGSVTWSGATMRSEGLASTMMACPEPIAALERTLLQLLENRPTVAIDGESLILSGGGDDGVVVLELLEQHPPALVGTRWGLIGIVKDRGVHSLPEGVAASLMFDGSEVVVEFGCNTGGGEANITEESIEFGPLRTSRKMCPPEIMAVEHHMAGILHGSITYEIVGEELRLTNGEQGLRLRPG